MTRSSHALESVQGDAVTRPSSPPSGRIGSSLSLGVACVALPPLLLLVDYAAAYARGWRAESPVERVVLFVAAGVLVLGAAGLATAAGRAFLRNPRLVLAIGATLIAGLAAEIAVAALAGPADSFRRFHLKPPNASYRFRPDPAVMPGVRGDARYTTNEMGLRAPPCPPRERARRILCVGGSTTICHYLDDAEAWPQLLMTLLNERDPSRPVWVGNAGKNGYSSVHHVAFLEQFEPLRTMDVVLFLVGINDLTADLRQETPRIRSGAPPLWRRSRSIDLVAGFVQTHVARARLELEDDAGRVYEPRRRLRRSARSEASLPDLEAPLRAFEGRIRRLIELVRRAGAVPVFLTQPVLWDFGLSDSAASRLWFGQLADGSFLAVPALCQGIDAYNGKIRATCGETGADCIDLTDLSGREELFYDDCHFSEAGAREVAARIADDASRWGSAAPAGSSAPDDGPPPAR
jgi:lysophospholipase L1-like esterase